MFCHFIYRKPLFTEIFNACTKVVNCIIYYQPSVMTVIEGVKFDMFCWILSIVLSKGLSHSRRDMTLVYVTVQSGGEVSLPESL